MDRFQGTTTVRAIRVLQSNLGALGALLDSFGGDLPFIIDTNDGDLVAVILPEFLPDGQTRFVKVNADGSTKPGNGRIVPVDSWLVEQPHFLTFEAPPPTMVTPPIVNGRWDRGVWFEGMTDDEFSSRYR